jgi:N-acetylmuramoyl-L-alanine amidase
MRVAIVVGHSADSQGARAVNDDTEFVWCGDLAGRLLSQLNERGIEARVFNRPTRGRLSARFAALCAEVNAYGPDLVLSLHFNAMPPEHARLTRGTEVLYWRTSGRGKAWARRIGPPVAEAIGTRWRGVVPREISWAGVPLYILRDTRAPAVILETHFGSHAGEPGQPGDHRLATEARDSGRLSAAIADAIAGKEAT